MFSFFDGKKGQSQQRNTPPDWLSALEETKTRLFAFLEKLEERMQELVEAAVPELQSLKREDEREFGNMYSGVQGQLNSIRDKARKTYEEKVEGLYGQLGWQIDVMNPYYVSLSDFSMVCSDRFHRDFEDKYVKCRERLEQTQFTDYEVIYQQILDEHELIKNQFKCHQCGDTIPLTKIYFITTHLTCPSCQTKNTFHPSTLARGLEHVTRSLAEQRTQHILEQRHAESQKERDFYHQVHTLKLSLINVTNTAEKRRIEQQIADLETQRKAAEKRVPQLYAEYQRAMFDEWKRLLPDLAEHNERFYESLNRGRRG